MHCPNCAAKLWRNWLLKAPLSRQSRLKPFETFEYNLVRGRIVAGEPRIDGRDNKTVRGLNIEIGVLPRVHALPCLHARNPSLGSSHLGSPRDAPAGRRLRGERKEGFMLHYNFRPSPSVSAAAWCHWPP